MPTNTRSRASSRRGGPGGRLITPGRTARSSHHAGEDRSVVSSRRGGPLGRLITPGRTARSSHHAGEDRSVVSSRRGGPLGRRVALKPLFPPRAEICSFTGAGRHGLFIFAECIFL
ncbi:hypothetical protein NHX12_029553 [Muraenolepis orangiensis]|uniref:Uncharacterized protein n=1 Tax=Muraenolepis orangiensis TaxID=630683 RepID=A0A9Q0E6F5_9TELE|nr:hypothetical protein NHX12_029553 [Muraenolepis orangiensis]